VDMRSGHSTAERELICRGERVWPELSLFFALRDMEDEGTPIYTTSDLKLVFPGLAGSAAPLPG
jgi:hypothetical protein